jgi:uncharacterized protein YjbI with pentapeptide repeats
MASEEHLAIFHRGIDAWNDWRVKNPSVEPDLKGLVLVGKELTNLNLSRVHLDGAVFKDVYCFGTQMAFATLNKADFDNVTFSQVDLSSAMMNAIKAHLVVFHGSNLTRAQLQNSLFSPDVRRVAPKQNAVFRRSNLSNAILANSDLKEAWFSMVDLRGTDLANCQLQNSTFSDVIVDAKTRLQRATVARCTIARYTLECLEDYGGLTKGDRMLMEIKDDVATLRQSYSGPWQIIHVAALLLFSAPYLWFVAQRWSEIQFDTQPAVGVGTMIPLWEALGRYIYNGGLSWRDGWALSWLAFGTFLFSLAYNVVRAVLLGKTMSLELQERISGLPPMFTLRGNKVWHPLYLVATWGFWINLIMVLLHTAHFMSLGVRVR